MTMKARNRPPVLLVTLLLWQMGLVSPAWGQLLYDETVMEDYGSNRFYARTKSADNRWIMTENPDWMRTLPDLTPMSRLSVPGTHETMSSLFPELGGKCNTMGLETQLRAGIRLIDVRLRVNADGNLEIWHNVLPLYADLRDVLSVGKLFLDAHPSEAVLMRLAQTGPARKADFWELVTEVLDEYPGLVWEPPTPSTVPVLGQVRGKILILQEVLPGETTRWVGLDYGASGAVFDKRTDDEYAWDLGCLDLDRKWEAFRGHIAEANESQGLGRIFVTSVTGAAGFPGFLPTMAALGCGEGGINKKLYEYLDPESTDISLSGLIMVDLPGGGLIKRIIALNSTLVDTTPPVITLAGEPSVLLECGLDSYTDPGATAVDDFTVDVAIVVGGDIVDPTRPGSYTVTYDATDEAGNAAEQVIRTVIVQDTMPPGFRSLTATPDLLWPPNHKLVTVTFQVNAVDLCDPAPRVVLASVASSEPDDDAGGGDGNTRGDIQGAEIGMSDFSILLRAERQGNGGGRTYSIGYSAVDESGNRAGRKTAVVVPR